MFVFTKPACIPFPTAATGTNLAEMYTNPYELIAYRRAWQTAKRK